MSPQLLLIERTTDTPIKPCNIDGDSAFTGVFGKREQENLAVWIVRLCQSRKSWLPFKLKDLANFYALHNHIAVEDFEEAVLVMSGKRWLIVDDGVITLAMAFVTLCYLHAPVLGLPRKKRIRKPKAIKRISRYEVLQAKLCI